MKFILLPLFWPLYAWLTIASAFPTPTANYDFMHISEKESLTISISKNSPPLAALNDETLPLLKVEPTVEIPRPKNSIYMATENKSAWTRLQKVSKHFEKEQKKTLRARQLRVIANTVSQETAPTSGTRISELVHLVQPVNYAGYPAAYQHIPQTPRPSSLAAVKAVEKESPTHYVWPSVDRRLPRGEDAPPIVMDRAPQSAKRQDTQPALVKNEVLKKSSEKVKIESVGYDGGGQIEPANVYTLMGQIELQGGLAVAVNTLKVEWKTGQELRQGVVDYANGQFTIQVPNINTGKIFATLLDGDQNILGQGIFDLNEEDPSKIKITIEPIVQKTRGTVISAYSYGNVKIPVEGAEVFAPSQIREMVEKNGDYKIQGLGSDSTFIIEAYAPENWGTRIITEAQRMERVPLFSNKMLQSLFDLVGESSNNTEYGVIWGEIKKKNNPVEGVEVALNSKDAIGPIYFNDLRLPDKNLKNTSSNGLYAFIKVPAGLHVVHARKQAVELPSRVIAAAPSLVSYSEINLKALTISGRVYDPLLKQNIPSNISFVGTSQTTQSGEGGFKVKIPSTDAVIFMDAHSGEDYFVSRAAIAKTKAKKALITAVSKKWLTEVLRDAGVRQDPSLGILLGTVSGGYNVSLDNEKAVDENLFYFNENDRIETDRIDSPESGGMFLITNLKPGLHTVVISSKDGQLVNTQVIVSEAGILNVLNISSR